MKRAATLPARNPRGMTLLELLVATAIFATLISALYLTLFGGMKLRETANADSEAQLARARVVRVLQSDLQNLVVPSGLLSGPLLRQTASHRDARADTLEFYATNAAVTDEAPWGDIQKISYSLEDPLDPAKAGAGKGRDFTRQVRRDLLSTVVEEEDVPPAECRLLSGVKSLTIQYYDGSDWTDSWDSTAVENENPAGVLLRLELEPDADGRPRPPVEMIREIGQQPRTAAAAASSASSGGGGVTPPAGGGGL